MNYVLDTIFDRKIQADKALKDNNETSYEIQVPYMYVRVSARVHACVIKKERMRKNEKE